MRKLLALSTALALLAFAGASHADEARPPKKQWYGWQTLTSDAAALGTLVLAGETDSDTLGAIAFGAYFIGPPVIHAAHGSGERTLGSFAMRVTMPIVGFAVGCELDDHRGWFGCLDGAALGTLVGASAAIAIDAAAMSWSDPSETARDVRSGKVSFAPSISKSSVAFGLVGAF